MLLCGLYWPSNMFFLLKTPKKDFKKKNIVYIDIEISHLFWWNNLFIIVYYPVVLYVFLIAKNYHIWLIAKIHYMFFSKKFRHVGTTIRVEIRFLLRLSLTATSFQVYMLKAFKQKKNESSKRRWYFQKSSGHSYKLFVVIIGEICEVYFRDRNKALISLFTVSKTDVKKKK